MSNLNVKAVYSNMDDSSNVTIIAIDHIAQCDCIVTVITFINHDKDNALKVVCDQEHNFTNVRL